MRILHLLKGYRIENRIEELITVIILFRLLPRVLINAEELDIRTTILGSPSSCPVYITSFAHADLIQKDGDFVCMIYGFNKSN